MTDKVNLTEALKKYFGFDKFKGDQEAIIRNVLAGNDTFVLMPTGGGKSLTFQLPALMAGEAAGELTVVISPLQSLMMDQVENLKKRGIADQSRSSFFLFKDQVVVLINMGMLIDSVRSAARESG